MLLTVCTAYLAPPISHAGSKAAVAAVREKGMICVLDIDMQVGAVQSCNSNEHNAHSSGSHFPSPHKGVRSIKTTDLNPVCVLIKPPSLAALVSSECHLLFTL